MSNDLEDLPNIGKVLADRLRAAGVTSPAELTRIGDADAFRKIRHDLPEDACTHTRLALAGAVRGVRWHSLDAQLRAKLKDEAHA
jgi:DNA transformation protein and related proteins